jgi:glycerophosphoryl diester phosphodiesterase
MFPAEIKLREYIRTFVRELLSTNEITQTGDIAGYNTPFAFSSKKKKDKDKEEEVATNSTGYEVVKEGRYHQWRNDDTLNPKQKIGMAMRETRDCLKDLERTVQYNVRLKNELKVDSRDYWKTTHKALGKISERLVKLANKVGKLY